MIKTLSKLVIEGIYLNIIKAIEGKPIVNIILNVEKLKSLPLKSETRQECSLLPVLFNMVLEVLIKTISQAKEIKDIHIEKKKVKLSVCTWHELIHRKKDTTKNC